MKKLLYLLIAFLALVTHLLVAQNSTALDFDGVNDFVDVNSNFTHQNFTIEMWVNPGSTQLEHADIIDNNHNNFQNWTVQQFDNNVNVYRFMVFNSGPTICVFTLTAGVWQHVALVKSSTHLECYINGALSVSQPFSGKINYNAQQLRLGRWGGGGRYWSGMLDEVRIWNRPLSQTEIQNKMTQSLQGNEEGLVLYYDFEEGIPNGNNAGLSQVFDNASNFHGTPMNMTKTGVNSNWVSGLPFRKAPYSFSSSFWGIAREGGTYNEGTVFKTDANGDNLTKIFDFNGGSSGNEIYRGLVQAKDGNLYGTTRSGGQNSRGVLYVINPFSFSYTKLHDFASSSGSYPENTLIEADNGKLYGMTVQGGANNRGVLFEYNPYSDIYLVKYHFGYGNGNYPRGGLMQASNGKLYGLVTDGGGYGRGVLFEYDLTTDSFTKLNDFKMVIDGSFPRGRLVEASNGNLYGMTYSGGNPNKGTLFEYNIGNATFTKKIEFNGSGNGKNPYESKLVIGENGKLYGMTLNGGTMDDGVLFEYDPSTNTLTKKYDFEANISGKSPTGSLMIAKNGKFYGNLQDGGNNGEGAFFEYDLTTNSLVKKHDFNTLNGSHPKGDVIEYCPQNISLTGNGNQIANNASPELHNSTNFGKLSAGATQTNTFTISNSGNAHLDLTGSPLVATTGSSAFTVVNQPSVSSLAPGESTSFDVEYNISAGANELAQICIANNSLENPVFKFDVSGASNTAMHFDGVDDFISVSRTNINSLGLTSQATWEFWLNPHSTAVSQNLIDMFSFYNVDGMYIHMNSANFFYTQNSPTFSSQTIATLPIANVWTHVAVVKEGTNVKIYYNGVFQTSNSSHAQSIISSNADLEIGRQSSGNSFTQYFKGKLDEVRIWNRALCQAEIQGRINNAIQGNENGLVAYYDFEEGVPNNNNTALTQVIDKAKTNHGTPNGFAKNGGASNWVPGKDLVGDGLVSGALATWNGSTSSDWNTASNWTPGLVPSQCHDVVIPQTSNNPTFSNNQAVNSITIETNAILTVGAGGCLWVGSSFKNNGDFILEATSSNFAQYQGPQVKGTLSQVIGEAGWHNIASPFIDATLGDIIFNQNAFLQFGLSDKCNIQYYDGGEHQASPPNAWTNAWGSWVPASGLTDPFDGSRAYNLFLDNLFADAFPVTMTVTATIRNATNTQQLNGANGGWNMLGNPFSSVIDWEKWSDNSAINNTYYVWDAATNNYNTYMSGGVGVPAAMTQFIAPYQSVFVRTSNGQNNNSGDEPDVFQDHISSRADLPTECPTAINSFYKNEVTGRLYLQAKTINGNGADQLAIRFGNNFSEGFMAAEEAEKFFSPAKEVPAIYTIIEVKPYVISSFPQPDVEVQHIPLGLKTNAKRIQIQALEIPIGLTAILEDKEKKEFHNLKTSYTFTLNSTLTNMRFILHVGDKFLTEAQLGASEDYIAYIANGELRYVYSTNLLGGEMQLLNMSGQVLAYGKVEENGSVSVSHLPVGLYIITVQNSGKFYKQKVVVK